MDSPEGEAAAGADVSTLGLKVSLLCVLTCSLRWRGAVLGLSEALRSSCSRLEVWQGAGQVAAAARSLPTSSWMRSEIQLRSSSEVGGAALLG